jgi:hypothetical protein
MRKLFFKTIVSALLVFLVASCCTMIHPMRRANGDDFRDVTTVQHHVLIATQGSKYKEAVVSGVVEALEEQEVHIKVIDVSGLSEIQVEDWDAIVILHTWQASKPQKDAEAFLKKQDQRRKIIVHTTSGKGTNAMDGVDAITGASCMRNVSDNVEVITNRLYSIILID